uniref:Uncharacterized protein n=1 Tax=Rhizophora mucronata TaxID=61149 RepID=A0A2P2JER6_RHIMU
MSLSFLLLSFSLRFDMVCICESCYRSFSTI